MTLDSGVRHTDKRDAASAGPEARGRRQALRRRRSLTYLLSLALLFAGAGLLWLYGDYPVAGQAVKPAVIMIPLDSRPVNTDLPRRIAGIAGISVALPELELLDQFLTPSDPVQLFEWLKDQSESKYDVTIIHINELLFGGLLNSRESAQYEQTNRKLQVMFDYLLMRSRTSSNRLILVYIMPRLLPSQYDEAMWEYEVELPEFSQLKHRLALDPGDEGLAGRIKALETIIPREIRSRYQSVFAEAYNAGLSMLDWLGQGLVDEVVIGLDDSAEYGLNVKAFNDLKALARQRDQKDAFFLHGADELSALIIARHTLDYSGGAEDFQLRYLSEGQEDVIPPYEAMPLKENFREKAAYLFDGKQDEEKTGDQIRDKSLPSGNQRNYLSAPKYIYLFTDQESSDEQMRAAWAALRSDKERPKRAFVGLADVAKVNGAWAPLIECVGPDQVYRHTDAYAGWNTAGNSLGTVMAHLMFWEAAQGFPVRERKEAADRHENLQKLRIVDDYFYQSKIRQKLIDWTVERNFPYLDFGSRWNWDDANDQVTKMMTDELLLWPGLAPADRANQPKNREASPMSFEFPWPRTFEIRIVGY